MRPNILLVDDEPAIQLSFSEYLVPKGYSVRSAGSLAEARSAVSARHFDVILLDLKLPDGNGADWLPELRTSCPDIAIVVITAYGDIPLAVEAMRRGADNFLTKPVDMEDLDVFLRKGLELEHLRRERSTQQRLSQRVEPYWGESPAAKATVASASQAAQADSAVLLEGETGTGKGVLARWIHDQSQTAGEPFVEVNCASLRGELLASELFGHAKGAFTSAVESKRGLIEIASGGTLFLDEIATMDIGVQAQFLNLVEQKRYRRLGEVTVRASEFRLICATNHDLNGAIREGSFRRDLYFRINVLPISLPPLRHRQRDIPGLVSHLLAILGAPEVRVAPAGLELLTAYPWPGNVRELRNVLERALVLSGGKPLGPKHFRGLDSRAQVGGDVVGDLDLAKHEEAHISKVLDLLGGDTKKAAEALGISRSALYRKLRKARGKQAD